MQNIKKYFMTLALLLTAVGGAWADETPLLTIESKDYESFISDSKTFDDMVTITFSNLVYNAGDYFGWYADSPSLLTVAGTNGYTITSCKFYTNDGQAMTGYNIEGESPSVYLSGGGVYTDNSELVYIGDPGITKIEVYGTAAEITEWSLKPDETGKTWTLAKMPASDVELQVEYYAESNLFLSKDALADKANIAVTAGKDPVELGDDGKSANTVTEGSAMTVKFNGTKKVLGVKAEKKAAAPSLTLTSPEVGQVIGSDGKNYAYGSLPTGVTAVAKICYVSGSNGLALALTDEGAMSWSTAIEKCAAHTPAFTGGTWKLATKDEWNSMITAAGSYSALRDGFSSVGGTNMQSDVYRSSTEDGSDKAWYYVFIDGYGDWYADSKDDALYVRACLAF